MSRVVVQLSLGAAESLIVIDDLAVNPEVLRDVVSRCREGLNEAVNLYVNNGLPGEDVYDDSIETLNELFGGTDADAE